MTFVFCSRVSQKTKFVDCWSVDLWIFWRINRSTDLKFVDMSTNFKSVSQKTEFACWSVDFFCQFVDKIGWRKNSVFSWFLCPRSNLLIVESQSHKGCGWLAPRRGTIVSTKRIAHRRSGSGWLASRRDTKYEKKNTLSQRMWLAYE
jgi:hypothetical protein